MMKLNRDLYIWLDCNYTTKKRSRKIACHQWCIIYAAC